MTNVQPLTKWQTGSFLLGGLLLIVGCVLGLTWAPPEKHMGDVSRILFVHVPAAWNTLLFCTFALGFAVMSLWTGKQKWDARMVATIEVSCVLSVILLLTGSIFGRPTWGVWWDWDVRLTSTLVGLVLYAGVLALRSFLPDPERRASWSAVATIVAWVDIPIIYFCVRWFRSLHQVQSSPDTVSPGMVLPLRINAFGILFFAIGLVALRIRLEQYNREQEEVPEPARLDTVTVS